MIEKLQNLQYRRHMRLLIKCKDRIQDYNPSNSYDPLNLRIDSDLEYSDKFIELSGRGVEHGKKALQLVQVVQKGHPKYINQLLENLEGFNENEKKINGSLRYIKEFNSNTLRVLESYRALYTNIQMNIRMNKL